MVDHSVFLTAAFAIHFYWMWKTDYRNGERDLFGPYPRGGPHKKPRVINQLIKYFLVFLNS